MSSKCLNGRYMIVIVCVLGLLDLANSYCEQQLKRRCERIIRQAVN